MRKLLACTPCRLLKGEVVILVRKESGDLVLKKLVTRYNQNAGRAALRCSLLDGYGGHFIPFAPLENSRWAMLQPMMALTRELARDTVLCNFPSAQGAVQLFHLRVLSGHTCRLAVKTNKAIPSPDPHDFW